MKIAKIFTLVLLLTVYVSDLKVADAACQIGDPIITDPVAQLKEIMCPIQVGFNILILGSGVAFVFFVLYGTIKILLSQGDVKAIQSGKDTITYTVFGFVIVLFIYAAMAILLGFFGVSFNPLNPFGGTRTTIDELYNWVRQY